MALISGLDLPWFVLTGTKGEVALRLDRLEGFIVEAKDTGITVTLHLIGGTGGIEVPMTKKQYAIFLRALVLYQDAMPAPMP